jgi:predicted ATPase
MTVLIGENGSGKSTILECLELLRKASEPGFMAQFYAQHRGMPGLLRKGAPAIELGVVIELEDGDVLEYAIRLEVQGAGAAVTKEHLKNIDDRFKVLELIGARQLVWDERRGQKGFAEIASSPGSLAISSPEAQLRNRRVARVAKVLAGIEVHIGFDTVASWAARSYQRIESLRVSNTLFPAERLSLRGFNLANAWSALRGHDDAHWLATMSLVRLGLGDHIKGVTIVPDPGGGNVYLGLHIDGLPGPVLAADLSDGQLAWLAFVAMTRLNPGRSLLCIDEPELHLHPALLGRVMSLLSSLPGGAPVLISTHSDRVLELLDEPAQALRVCSLQQGKAEVATIDPDELPRWLAEFGDLGQLRASGYLPRVLVANAGAADRPEAE